MISYRSLRHNSILPEQCTYQTSLCQRIIIYSLPPPIADQDLYHRYAVPSQQNPSHLSSTNYTSSKHHCKKPQANHKQNQHPVSTHTLPNTSAHSYTIQPSMRPLRKQGHTQNNIPIETPTASQNPSQDYDVNVLYSLLFLHGGKKSRFFIHMLAVWGLCDIASFDVIVAV
jgi:hypothetical protein